MKETKNLLFRRAFLTLLGVLLVTFSASRGFPGSLEFCKKFEELPLTLCDICPEGSHNVLFEALGTLIVIHGFGTSGEGSGIDPSNPEKFVKVEQSVELPAYVNRATVFLNGWKSNYSTEEHHNVLGLGSFIGNIRLQDGKLTWNAIGILRDNKPTEAYRWTYYYTVIAWNDAVVSVMVNHDDADNFCKAGTGGSDNFYFAKNEGETTSLSSFSSFLQNPDFPLTGIVAVLPRGFGFAWDGSDHNLRQLAYNLDHSQKFVEYGKSYQKAFEDVPAPLPTPASLANSGFVSWNTYGIFKDDAGRRDYIFGEMVSALGGNDFGVLQPPFSILPGFFVCPHAVSYGAITEEFVIENVPFQYAIPMLTGWQLDYAYTDDKQVKEIGIWIDKWHYDKDPVAPTGTLYYTLSSVLSDSDVNPHGHCRKHKVTILGLWPTTSVTPTEGPPAHLPE